MIFKKLFSILLHEISIWYNRKIELNIWYRKLCLPLQRPDVSCSSWPGLHTLQQGFWPTTYILVSSDHTTFSLASFGSSRWSLANFRRAWTCAGLSRGTLRTLQDFNPWRCSVLLMVTVETMIPALFRSLTRSSRVVLGWSLTFLRIIDTPRGEILHWAPVQGRLTVILNFFNFLIIAPTVVAFSPSCLPVVL